VEKKKLIVEAMDSELMNGQAIHTRLTRKLIQTKHKIPKNTFYKTNYFFFYKKKYQETEYQIPI
jgi:hypothetical protein